MPLFERFHLSQEEAEARLKRALTGDPTRGEIGLLAALVANKLDDVHSRLARDATLGADLRHLVAEHLQKGRARWETRKAWSVTLPLPIWDEHAREARITGRSITEGQHWARVGVRTGWFWSPRSSGTAARAWTGRVWTCYPGVTPAQA